MILIFFILVNKRVSEQRAVDSVIPSSRSHGLHDKIRRRLAQVFYTNMFMRKYTDKLLNHRILIKHAAPVFLANALSRA